MKAIVRHQFGGPEVLRIEEVPTPQPAADQVLIRIRAFGINRAEQYFRLGKWGEVSAISGIECVGEVAQDRTGNFAVGQSVIALMGGMGRTISGSYAEFVCVPASNVVAVQTDLDWAELAALPESYATAWSCLHGNLQIQREDVVVIRGATSALGQAAVNIAAHAGVNVIATVRDKKRSDYMHALGAQKVLVESTNLSQHIREHFVGGVNGVLDLVGNSTLLDSLQMLKRGGHCSMAGFLGGSDPIEQFDPLRHLPSGRHLSFFGSAFVYGTEEFPLSDIPFQTIIDRSASGIYQAKPLHIFQFDEIQKAHELLDAYTSAGKMVVVV